MTLINIRIQLALALIFLAGAGFSASPSEPAVFPEMYYADTTFGAAFAKDPDVVRFDGRYFMYYTIKRPDGFAVGIAASADLTHWERVGALLPDAPYEAKGLAAPAAMVYEGAVHLFYQTYGNREKDAICHAVSEDGVHFERDGTNPIFSPEGEWTCGRAIDAEVVLFKDNFWLFCATRDPDMKIQMIAVASAPRDADFGRGTWTQRCTAPILKSKLPWEQACIEAPAICEHNGRLYMFYAGAYNNKPQQIGCAVSDDAIHWKRLSDKPLLPNGAPGEWNSSESGHPGVFVDDDGRMYLFFQGNHDNGKTWHLSKMHIEWEEAGPYLIRPRDGKEFQLK